MSIADNARNLAISLEAKKDKLAQLQSNDWKVTFTVQNSDMVERFTSAPMGTRYAMVLVEIGDDEQPVERKEASPAPRQEVNPRQPDGGKREKMDWREVQPAAQAGIRCADPMFQAFLREVKNCRYRSNEDETGNAAAAVRDICGVHSRVELGTVHAARIIWHQLDSEYQAWKALEHA